MPFSCSVDETCNEIFRYAEACNSISKAANVHGISRQRMQNFMKDKDALEELEKAGKPLKGVYRLRGGGRKAMHATLDALVLKWIDDLK